MEYLITGARLIFCGEYGADQVVESIRKEKCPECLNSPKCGKPFSGINFLFKRNVQIYSKSLVTDREGFVDKANCLK